MTMASPIRSTESGSAMVMALLVVIALSIMGSALAVLAMSETYGSMNYRLMSQARYGAESAVHRAANFFLNNYVPPTNGGGDPIASYTITASPVTAGGAPVVLSGLAGVGYNYPVPAVQTAFQNATTSSLVVGNANVQYTASATLVSMRQILAYGVAVPITIQTWRITGNGSTTGARQAQVQVTATLERETGQIFNFAVFATAATCGALKFGGGAVVDSYDSQNIQYGANGKPITQGWGGNIGSNGNLNEGGTQTTVYGTMSTPKTGVGNCASGAVDAWTSNGQAQVTGGLIPLPQTLSYPAPDPPNPMPPATSLGINKNDTCGSLGLAGCAPGNPSGLILSPGTYGNLGLTAQATIHLTGGVYTLNSISLAGGSAVIIDSGPVIFNVGGQGAQTPVDFTGGSLANGSLNPAFFQIQYAGTGTIKLSGNSGTSGAVYAPNAAVTFTGGSDYYGSVIAATVDDTGGTSIHNDRQLANNLMTVGNYMLSAFSWQKF